MYKRMAHYNSLSVNNELFTVLKCFDPGKTVCIFHTEFIAEVLKMVFLQKNVKLNYIFLI